MIKKGGIIALMVIMTCSAITELPTNRKYFRVDGFHGYRECQEPVNREFEGIVPGQEVKPRKAYLWSTAGEFREKLDGMIEYWYFRNDRNEPEALVVDTNLTRFTLNDAQTVATHKALLPLIEAACRRNKCRRLWIFAGISKETEPFYRELGYQFAKNDRTMMVKRLMHAQ